VVNQADDTIHLFLSDIANFFQTPEVDPFAGENIELSGIDQLIDTMNARSGRTRAIHTIAIHLPETTIVADLAARVKTALTNYCNAQIRVAVQKKTATWLEGRKALRIGLAFSAVCLALSLGFEELFFVDSLFGRFFSEGFIIAGWVALWRPAELLLYDWQPYAREIKRYEEIKAMDIRLLPRSDAAGTLPPEPFAAPRVRQA
jgi:hypothetical protein